MPESANKDKMDQGAHPPRSHRQPPATPAIAPDASATTDRDAVHKDDEYRADGVPAMRIRPGFAVPEPAPPLPLRTRSPQCWKTIPEALPAAPGQTPAHASGKQSPPLTAR